MRRKVICNVCDTEMERYAPGKWLCPFCDNDAYYVKSIDDIVYRHEREDYDEYFENLAWEIEHPDD